MGFWYTVMAIPGLLQLARALMHVRAKAWIMTTQHCFVLALCGVRLLNTMIFAGHLQDSMTQV